MSVNKLFEGEFRRFFGGLGVLLGPEIAVGKHEFCYFLKKMHWPEKDQEAILLARDFIGALLYFNETWFFERIAQYLPIPLLRYWSVKDMLFRGMHLESSLVCQPESFFCGVDALRQLLIRGLQKRSVKIEEVLQSLSLVENEGGFQVGCGGEALQSLYRHGKVLSQYEEFRAHILERLAYKTADEGYPYADLLPVLAPFEDTQRFLARYLLILSGGDDQELKFRGRILSRLEGVIPPDCLIPEFQNVIEGILCGPSSRREQVSATWILHGEGPEDTFSQGT